MNKRLLDIIVCPSCRSSSFALYKLAKEATGDGILVCRKCRDWFIIDDGILELVCEDINHEHKINFFQKHNKKLAKLRLKPRGEPKTSAAADQKKFQMKFFDDFSSDYILETHSFWRAYYSIFFETYFRKIRRGSIILDFGCGSGLGSVPFLTKDYTVVGIDLSRRMVEKAMARVPATLRNRHIFLVADAEDLPFRSNVFDAGIGMGILHHVHSPQKAVNSLTRCLKLHGIYLGHENNKTIFRYFFNLLMRVFPLWHEEAGEEQLFSARDIERLYSSYSVASSTHIFLPPHFFNCFSARAAKMLILWTDKISSRMPFLRNKGGTITFEAQKTRQP